MHPILWTLKIAPSTAHVTSIVLSVLLSLFIVWDGVRMHGMKRLAGTIAGAVGFLAVGLTLSLVLITKAHLPDPVVIDIRSWGVATIIAMCACFIIQRRLGREIGLSGEQILSLWVYGGLAAVAGARALHVAVNWSWYAPNPLSAIAFWDGGMVYVGGVTAAVGITALYARREGIGIRAFDVLAIGIALTQGIGRIGCFLAGCCYGKATTLPWGVRFGEGSIAHYTLVETGSLPRGALETMPLHPTQLYEAIACFAIGLLLYARYRRGRGTASGAPFAPGTIICSYFILYPLARFMLELLRDDPDRQFLFRLPETAPVLLSTSQTAGILLVAAAAFALVRLQRMGGAELR